MTSISPFRRIPEQQLLQIRPWSFLHRPFPSIIQYNLNFGLCCNFSEIILLPLNDIIINKIKCGKKLPTRCNRGFYCRSYCLLNMFRASLCPSSGAQEYYTVVAACGISCCGISSSWSGVELRVMRPVCRMLVYQHPT